MTSGRSAFESQQITRSRVGQIELGPAERDDLVPGCRATLDQRWDDLPGSAR